MNPVNATILSFMSEQRIKQILKPFTDVQARKFHNVSVIPFFLHQRSHIENQPKIWQLQGSSPLFIVGNDGVIITAVSINEAYELTEKFEKMASIDVPEHKFSQSPNHL
jgi:ribulose-5-phosphate 4-epimerase/fuculose-1-phosphate aldolase